MLARGIDAIRNHLGTLPPAALFGVGDLRVFYDNAANVFTLAEGVTVVEVAARGVPAEMLTPASCDPARLLLYLHGGGYALGSPRSHRHMVAEIAVASGCRALVLDYRRAPEHPFPAPIDDALAAYRWILDAGIRPEAVAIAGDSAGGGLTIATLLAARDAGLPLPAAAVCISPWADLTNTAETHRTKAATDPMVKTSDVTRWARAYLGGAPATTPLASPVFADLAGLPPLLIQVGSEEVLLDDARTLARRAEAAAVEANLDVWDGMIHVWHWFGPFLDEAAAGVRNIAGFLRQQTAA